MWGDGLGGSDLKPSNIGLCGAGHVKVFDLGLSVVKEVRQSSSETYQVCGGCGVFIKLHITA